MKKIKLEVDPKLSKVHHKLIAHIGEVTANYGAKKLFLNIHSFNAEKMAAAIDIISSNGCKMYILVMNNEPYAEITEN